MGCGAQVRASSLLASAKIEEKYLADWTLLFYDHAMLSMNLRPESLVFVCFLHTAEAFLVGMTCELLQGPAEELQERGI